MSHLRRLALICLLLIVSTATTCCAFGTTLHINNKKITNSENPTPTFRPSDLVGPWRGQYPIDHGSDLFIIRADGTFKQVYRGDGGDYVFETPWNEWWIEEFSDGRVRIHLRGARYYYSGISIAEAEGMSPTGRPRHFFDPFARYTNDSSQYFVEMAEALVLNVRVLPSGELILSHMWTTGDDAFSDNQLLHRFSD